MKKSKVEKIRNELGRLGDVKRVAEKYSVSPGTAFAILQQRRIRDAKKNFGKVAACKKRIFRDFKKGKSFVQIAKKFHVPPISILWALRDKLGMSKSEVRRMIRKPEGNSRVAKETRKAVKADFLQSKWGLSFMTWKGKTGEKLTSMLIDVDYITEDEIEEGKTPDFLLSEKMKLKGKEVKWIESKATFADKKEFSYNRRRQLSDYVELFGEGAVIYWMGKVENIDCDGITVLDGEDVADLLPPNGVKLYKRLHRRLPSFRKR